MNSIPKLSNLSMRNTVFEFTGTPYPVKDMLVNLDHLPKTAGFGKGLEHNLGFYFKNNSSRLL